MDPPTLAGPLVLAIMLNWGLYGLLALQTYVFYLATPLFPHDRLIAKLMVYSVIVLETAQTAISSLDAYNALANNFGSAASLDSIQQHWLTVPIFGALTGGIGQFFFAYRIWGITESNEKGTPIVIGVLGLASFGSGIMAGVTFYKAGTFTQLINDNNNLAAIGIWNGFGSLCDIIIALSMPYYLMRLGTGLRSTHIRIVNLVALIIETGFLTATIAILHFCLYFVKTTAFLIPGLTISKVYGNTMLAILNNRIVSGHLRDSSNDNNIDEASSPGGRSLKRGVYTLPSKTPGKRGESSIIVTKDRLVFRLDSEIRRPAPARSISDSEVQSSPIYGHAFGSETDLKVDDPIPMVDFDFNQKFA